MLAAKQLKAMIDQVDLKITKTWNELDGFPMWAEKRKMLEEEIEMLKKKRDELRKLLREAELNE